MVQLTFYYLLWIYYVTHDLMSRAPPLSHLIFSYEAETWVLLLYLLLTNTNTHLSYNLRLAAIRIQDGVAHTTLQDRIHGAISCAEEINSQHQLSPTETWVLAEYAITMRKLHFPLTPQDIRNEAQCYDFISMPTILGQTPFFLLEHLMSQWHHYDIISTYDITLKSLLHYDIIARTV